MESALILNTREIASLFWLAVGAVWLFTRSGPGLDFRGLANSFFRPQIIIPICAMLAWIGLEVWVGAQLLLWNETFLKPTLFWTFGSGAVLLFNCRKLSANAHFFRQTILGTLRVVVFVEFFMNLHVMSLLAELLVQAVILVLTLIMVGASLNSQHKHLNKYIETLLALVVFSLLIYSTQQSYVSWHQDSLRKLLLELSLPIWLTFGLLPYIYGFSLLLAYDLAFRLLNSFHSDGQAHWRARAALLTSFHVSVREMEHFRGYWLNQLSKVSTFAAARKVIGEFRSWRTEAARARNEKTKRLREFAGSNEADADGRRLDRREFKETISALQHLHMCQIGWYRNHGERYRPDLLQILDNNFTRQGLPEDPGITMHISADGQSWYAWRRTVTGWCFAIGAAGPPPNQWEFDGAQPPSGLPGEDPTWGTGPFSMDVSPNWC